MSDHETLLPEDAEDRRSERGLTYQVQHSRLEGSVRISGAKNSVLRLMAATLLTADRVRLANYPATLRDAQVHLGMLEALGKRCCVVDGRLVVEEAQAPGSRLEWHGRSIRNTLLILGALTGRTGAGDVPVPGGCNLGDRRYDLHVMLLEAMGARVTAEGDRLRAEAPGGLRGAEIHLPIRSTGATENALLCGALARGRTVLWGPHIRPEILDLVAMLREMGARIAVYGQERIEIDGVDALGGADHRVIPDNMEALSWVVGAAVTGGEIEIEDFPLRHLETPLVFLRESGVRLYVGEDSLIVRSSACRPVEIATGPYPGINSDMQPLFAVFGAMSPGESRIVDLRFPGRYAYAAELARMGVDARVVGDLLHVRGSGPLRGADVTALDLRAGIALTLAGFAAQGVTRIADAWQIERGYDRFVAKATALGARIATLRG